MGNEPNLYPGSQRPANYTNANYVAEWKTRVGAVVSQVLTGNKFGLPIRLFQMGTYVDVAATTLSGSPTANFTL